MFITTMVAMLGFFVAVIGFMRTSLKDAALQRKDGFDNASQERKSLAVDINQLKISQARLQALLEMSLFQKGLTFEQINQGVEKSLKSQGIINDDSE